MASSIPKEAKNELIARFLPAVETEWKVALFTNASNCMTQSTYAACTSQVASGNGYTTGGAVLAGRTSGYVDTNNVYLDATDSAWGSSTFTARYAILYETATGKIRDRKDFGGDKAVSTGTLTILWNASGIMKLS
jgi:hypothetical protein